MSEFDHNAIIDGNPDILQWTKDNLPQGEVQRLREEEYYPGSSETPGLQAPGSGGSPNPSLIGSGRPIDWLTINYEQNNGCTANSAMIANVRKYCEELQKHPRFKNKRCKDIAIYLAMDLYERYNKNKFGPKQFTHPDRLPLRGMSTNSVIQWLYSAKTELLAEYGITAGKKRIFGFTPQSEDEIPPEDSNLILPPAIQTWLAGDPFRGPIPGPGTPFGGPGGSAPDPPPRNWPTDAASACCPPEGCDVTVAFTDIGRYGGHKVAGKITQCDPLIIHCTEHPLQIGSVNGSYDLVFSQSGGTAATIRNARGSSTSFRHRIHDRPRPIPLSGLNGMPVDIAFIICFCD